MISYIFSFHHFTAEPQQLPPLQVPEISFVSRTAKLPRLCTIKKCIFLAKRARLGWALQIPEISFVSRTGANPMTAIYNASAVKIYNALSSLVRHETKTFSSTYQKRSILLQRCHCSFIDSYCSI
jgi:hypothetical protein